MNVQRLHRMDNLLLVVIGAPLLLICFGGVFSLPAIRLTREREPWLSLFLSVGLAISVFGLGCAAQAPLARLVGVWLAGVLLLYLARRALGSAGRCIFRFGVVHVATLLLLGAVLSYRS